MDGIPGGERQLPVMIDGLTAGVLPRVVEEENVPFLNPPLVVNVSIKFMDPVIRSQYGRSYASSRSFAATDRVCKGLLRRIEHCCEEFITRKDSGAVAMFADDTGAPKRQRYEMTFRIIRRESGQWAERTFRSYQKQPLTVGFTKEVILASHRMVGLFLRYHDQGFRWLDGSVLEDYQGPDTATPSVYGPLSPCCIPRSRFDEASQSFEFIPGYTIMLSFRSRTKRPSRTQFGKVVRINSEQNAPLNLYLAEELLWQILQSVQISLDAKKREFDDEHQQCEGFDGTEGTTACPHLDDDAVHIDLRISNNLGPSYDHLQWQFRSKLTIFRDDNLQDCLDFIRHLENEMMDARDQIDDKINLMNDFELRLLEVRSPTWSILEPVKVCIGPSASHSRRTVEAVLDRVQTGISDVLRGNNLSAHVAAYKRGHLVLDKALVARQGSIQSKKQDMGAEQRKEDLVARLKTRIQQDIDKVCKDTCSLDGIPKDDTPTEATPAGIHPYHIAEELRVEEAEAVLTTSRTAQRTTDITPQTPVRRTFSLTGRRGSQQESLPETRIDAEHQRPMSRPTTPATPTGSVRSSYTGTGSPRVFPLVPARYSMASQSSSASTLATDLSNIISSEPPLDSRSTGKDTIDSLALEILHGVQQVSTKEPAAAIVTNLVSASEEITSETPRNDVAHEQQSAHIDNVSEPDPSLEDGLPATNTQQFELGPPINFVRDADLPASHLRHVFRDWDSSSYGTADDDEDSGAILYERPQGDDTDDFTRSKPDIKKTSQPLPIEGHTGDNEEIGDHIGTLNSEDDCADELPQRNHENEQGRYTAPSTPGMSSGCDSSPRHSILMTPTIQRKQALVKSRILDYVQETKDDDGQDPKDTPLDLGDVDSGVNGQHPPAVSEIDVGDEDRSSVDRQGIALQDEDRTRSDASHVHIEEEELPICEAEEVVGGQEDTALDIGDDVNDNDEHHFHPEETVPDHAGVAVADESVTSANLEIVEAAMMELPPSPPASPELSATEGAWLKDEVAALTNEEDSLLDAASLSDQDEPAIEASEGIAVDQEEAAHPTFVPEVEIQDPASIQLPPSPEIRASEAIVELEAPVDEERAAVADAIVDSSNLEVIEPVSVHLPPSTPSSPQISATEGALLEVEDAVIIDEEDTHVDIGHSFNNEAISSEDGHVMVDDQESQQGSLPSDCDLRDPAAIELPLSPEIQANEGDVSLEASELDCELHISPVEEEEESTDIEIRHDDLELSDEAALEEVGGCEMQPTVLLLDLNPPTSIPETQTDPNTSELDTQEVQAVADDTLDTVMTEELEDSTLVAVTDMNTSETVPTEEPEPANTAASEWVVIEAEVLGDHQDVEPNDQEPEHPAEAPVAEVEVVDSVRKRAPQTPTAESFPSYLTAQEISNPYDDLPTEFDSMATPKALPSENRNTFWTRGDIPAPIRSNTAIFAPINPSPSPTILSSSRASFETTSSYTSSAPSIAHERDSVDTYAPSTISDPPEPEPEREYRPQTAGFLGLRRPDNVPRRFSMPLQYLWESGTGSDTTSRPGTAVSTGTVKLSRRKRRRDMSRSMSSGAVLAPVVKVEEKTEKMEEDGGRRRFLPRAVMIFAGMAFASKILNGDGD